MEIAGTTVVVTGGASGIGFAIAQTFGRAGARLVLADIEQGALDTACSQLAGTGVEAVGVRTDVRSPDDLEQLRQVADVRFGGADIVCNNAGIVPPYAPVWELSAPDVDWVLDVNLRGILNGIRAFVPGMIERGRPARVVNTSSMAALGFTPFVAGYAMTKAAVVAVSGSLREELQMVAPHVGVSVLLPEMVSTRLAFSERNRGDETAALDEDPELNPMRGGLDPLVIGERVLAAVRDERFWILPPPTDPFMEGAFAWMDEIRAASH